MPVFTLFWGYRRTKKKCGVLPTHRPGGVEAPGRDLESFSRRTLVRPAAKIRVPHFVQVPLGYVCPIVSNKNRYNRKWKNRTDKPNVRKHLNT